MVSLSEDLAFVPAQSEAINDCRNALCVLEQDKNASTQGSDGALCDNGRSTNLRNPFLTCGES